MSGRAAVAVVTGATGQDGRLLIPQLLERGYRVHALVRDARAAAAMFDPARVELLEYDLAAAADEAALAVTRLGPDVIFNLAGYSSVQQSFVHPRITWTVNADWPAALLEAIRRHAPRTRLYQASSSEMFGSVEGSVVHDEESAFRPQSPYAASKAAAHLLCGVYRTSFGVRVACGILFNHESRYRGEAFLTTKVAGHVARLRSMTPEERAASPLRVGRLDVCRDWGSAAEHVRGILLVADQIAVRNARHGTSEQDVAANYRDYVLGTGILTSVRELIDRAFSLGGFTLQWEVGEDGQGVARFADSGAIAVQSAPELFRAAEPKAIQADPSRAWVDLGWRATDSIDLFLRDMLEPTA